MTFPTASPGMLGSVSSSPPFLWASSFAANISCPRSHSAASTVFLFLGEREPRSQRHDSLGNMLHSHNIYQARLKHHSGMPWLQNTSQVPPKLQ